MLESISKLLSSLFGNERIQGLLVGMLLGLFCSMFFYGYRIAKIDIAGVHFENPDEIILTHEKQINELGKDNNELRERIKKLEDNLHSKTMQLGEFSGKLHYLESEFDKIRNIR